MSRTGFVLIEGGADLHAPDRREAVYEKQSNVLRHDFGGRVEEEAGRLRQMKVDAVITYLFNPGSDVDLLYRQLPESHPV